MNRHAHESTRAGAVLVFSLLALACLILSALTASGAKAFTHTISDIEDPAVKATVIDLGVQGEFQFLTEHYYDMGAGLFLVDRIEWNHSLKGVTDASLSEEQRPKVVIERNPTVVRVEGKVATEEATGQVTYENFEGCEGRRTTTKTPTLDVSIDGFYRPGTSSATANPGTGIATTRLDPWTVSCATGAPPEVTKVETFGTSTSADLVYPGLSGPTNLKPAWTPGAGGVELVENGCTAEYCDFTFTGTNTNSGSSTYGGSGNATTSFTLKLRLEYPPEPPPDPVAPQTRIKKGPKKLIKTRTGKARVAFRFTSTGPAGTTFVCHLDKDKFSPCSSPFKRKVGPGRHRFAVAAVNQGVTDATPAIRKFTVKKKLHR